MGQDIINELELRKEYEEKRKEVAELRLQLRTLHQEKEGYFSQLTQLHRRITSHVSKIKELKGELAFPVNISFNEAAAHQVPFAIDERAFVYKSISAFNYGRP